MSIEPEDALEEALRADLPTQEVEARLRRRMLAAGLAVGNGVAATTAAAAGATGAATTAAVTKAATFSWGLKVGLAATLAVSGVGLAWDHDQQASGARAPAAPPVPSAAETPPVVASSPRGAVTSDAERPAATEPVTSAPRRGGPPRAASGEETAAPTPLVVQPSAAEFAEGKSEAPANPGSTLSDETRLLDRAFAELAAGNRDAAAKLVREHEVRYPQGLLSKERERAKLRITELSRGE